MSTHNSQLHDLLLNALNEDCPQGDITTEWFLSQAASGTAKLISKDHGVFFGKLLIESIFEVLGGTDSISWFAYDGASVQPNDPICTIQGPLKTILKAERVMLNFVQRLSGIASTTHHFVTRLNNSRIQVLDTRKTTPLYRFLERQAVLAGGGFNHRLNLSDMVLLKENHLTQLAHEGRLSQLPQLMNNFKKQHPHVWIEIEIETLDQLHSMDLTHADVIMLDNFKLPNIEPAVKICKDRGFKALIEVSGNVTLDTIAQFSQLPIDRISVGSLTHSPKALDLSLLIQ